MPSALITGANRGLGLEFVKQYAADGWQVYAACRDPSFGVARSTGMGVRYIVTLLVQTHLGK